MITQRRPIIPTDNLNNDITILEEQPVSPKKGRKTSIKNVCHYPKTVGLCFTALLFHFWMSMKIEYFGSKTYIPEDIIPATSIEIEETVEDGDVTKLLIENNSTRSTIFLHVGPPKVASTTFQSFFARNYDLLLTDGYVYLGEARK